jgi:calcium-dependent protein kinase
MVESKKDDGDVFGTISNTFSTTDIRSVYTFIKMIGGGHFGTVRIANLKTDPDIIYAIKSILRENIAKDIKLLEEELFILQKVDHPNIVKFHQSYIDYRYVHIVMEHCKGGELFDRIVSAQKFTEKHAADIMKQMLSAVKHLHEHNIVHRDLKPENFLMEDTGENAEIKLIDFGLSKRFSQKEEVEKMHTVVGTPYYVAPEVLKGNYDKQCDVWSLGVILFVFLCGYPPFEGDNNKEIFKNVLKTPLTFDPADWDRVSDAAKDLISKMLEKEASKRISAQQCLEHEWFEMQHADEHDEKADKQMILNRMRQFRHPKKLQVECMTFLVNNAGNFDFQRLRNAFHVLDKDNSGTLEMSEIREAFSDMNIPAAELDQIFNNIDLNHDGEINYTEFLAVCVDRKRAVTEANLKFAFHHFDIDNTGVITFENLEECFKREGRHFEADELKQMLGEVSCKEKGKITYAEFCSFMKEIAGKDTV